MEVWQDKGRNSTRNLLLPDLCLLVKVRPHKSGFPTDCQPGSSDNCRNIAIFTH